MPISTLGTQPVASKVHQPQPTQQQQQPTRQQQQQKEHYHSCALHARKRGEVQKVVQKEVNPSTLQRDQYIKDHVKQPQGQGPQK